MDELDRSDVETARRLGSDQHARVAIDLAGEHDLLLVAPGEPAGARLRPAAANVELLHEPGRALHEPSREEPAGARDRCAAEVVQGDVLRDRELQHEATALPVLGDVAEAGVEWPRALTCVSSAPSRRTLPAATGRRPLSASISSVWPLPSMPAMPTISPARTSNETSRTFSTHGRRTPADPRPSGAPRRGCAACLSTRSSTSRPTISRARLSSVAPSRVDRLDLLPAAEDGDPVRDLQHLVELVGDEDDRFALVGKAADDLRRAPSPPAASAPPSARRGRGCRRRGRGPSGSRRAAAGRP